MDVTQILVIEDDLTFSELVQFQLSSVGFSSHNIIAVQSIVETREVAREFIPDVILLDLNILDSNGIETYDSVIQIFSKSSVVVLSGMDDQSLALQIVSKGAQDYILKSDIKPQLLEKTIKYGVLRRKLKEDLEVSEKKYKDVFYKSPMPMFKLQGKNLEIIMANQAAHDLYEVPFGGFDELSFYEFNSIGNTPFTELESGTSFKKEFIQESLSGKEIIVEVILNKLDSSLEMEFITQVLDRTEEIFFERRKNEVISQAEEGEKKKIARELHDGLGQNMVLLNLLFQSLKPSIEQEGQYNEVSNLLQSCIRELKEIAYSLLPPELENGFLNAINRFSNRINALGKINFVIEIQEGFVEADFGSIDKFNLYRIVQEFINNSMKHAQAQTLIFEIQKTESEILITISDDGLGFDMEKVEKGLGLQNLQHRMKMSNIKGKMESLPGQGSKLIMQISKLTVINFVCLFV
jgi:signal transduction histidine kinase